jgi:histidyl-tRNA synthetase
MSKPGIPKGTRDFGPREMARRNHIFSVIRRVFEAYGFVQIETPAMENLSTLTGKYGEEGDQLIFKILNNGDFLTKADHEAIAANDSKSTAFSISKKALRYDLTVPFARFVVMNQNDLAFPFRRYQIQPVWRGDRPGRGRYQEFFQCDVDIVGTDSLLCEVELIRIFDRALTELRIPNFAIHLNNRKVLAGIAEMAGVTDRLGDLTIAIDKLDKIGRDGVEDELRQRGFSDVEITAVAPLFGINGERSEVLAVLEAALAASEIGLKGVAELRTVVEHVERLGFQTAKLVIDPTLARGLDYYTGAIFEVKVSDAPVGSICGGGRYDDLTGIFGLKGLSGVGISFGADRIYDVMEHFELFPTNADVSTEVLIVNFDAATEADDLALAENLRSAGLRCELYPEPTKLKKQLKYANDKQIPFVVMAGDEERAKGVVTLKNMQSGEQFELAPADLAAKLRSNRS